MPQHAVSLGGLPRLPEVSPTLVWLSRVKHIGRWNSQDERKSFSRLQRWPKSIDDSSGTLMAITASFEAKSVRNTAWDERKGHSLAIRQLKNQKIGAEALLTCEYDQTVVDWTLQHSLNVTDVLESLKRTVNQYAPSMRTERKSNANRLLARRPSSCSK